MRCAGRCGETYPGIVTPLSYGGGPRARFSGNPWRDGIVELHQHDKSGTCRENPIAEAGKAFHTLAGNAIVSCTCDDVSVANRMETPP
jgi:hypothetical protein